MWAVSKWFSVTLWNAVKVVFSQANPCSLVLFLGRERSDSWNSGWPTTPTVMRTWQSPKPQHSTPRRRPDQELRKVFIIWVAVIFQRVLRSIFIPTGTTDTQGKHRIPINKLSTQVFIVSANNYTISAANFAQSGQTLQKTMTFALIKLAI